MQIDLVYLWVDDTDWNWKKKRNKYLETFTNYDADAVDECRFYNNDELLYSLRSVEKNAPWINKIFIITDNQTPSWLNINNPKIRIVNHTEIIPNEKLPIFNSCAIESRIPYIKDLSEYFLYANDDTYFWNPVNEDFFFKNDLPICRIDKFMSKYKVCKKLYGSTIQRAYSLIKGKYYIHFQDFFPHHNIDAYRKSLFIECIKEFQNEFDKTLNNRFRDFSDVQRIIISFYALAKGKAILKQTRLNLLEKILHIPKDSVCYHMHKIVPEKILNKKTKLVCINDSRENNENTRKICKELLEKKFPQKSSFEK